MQAWSFGLGMSILVAAPLATQAESPPPSSTAEIEQAAYCAAVQTMIAALLAQSSKADEATAERLKRSTVRWLQHAANLPPKDELLVMDRYRAQTEVLGDLIKAKPQDPSLIKAHLTEGMITCREAEQAIFGNSVKDR